MLPETWCNRIAPSIYDANFSLGLLECYYGCHLILKMWLMHLPSVHKHGQLQIQQAYDPIKHKCADSVALVW